MLAEAESDRLIGQVVGGAYELVGRIGEGGMGAVYEAHHLRLHKRVAVKVMSRAMAQKSWATRALWRPSCPDARRGGAAHGPRPRKSWRG
jgi:serine/threonine protein kinase